MVYNDGNSQKLYGDDDFRVTTLDTHTERSCSKSPQSYPCSTPICPTLPSINTLSDVPALVHSTLDQVSDGGADIGQSTELPDFTIQSDVGD